MCRSKFIISFSLDSLLSFLISLFRFTIFYGLPKFLLCFFICKNIFNFSNLSLRDTIMN